MRLKLWWYLFLAWLLAVPACGFSQEMGSQTQAELLELLTEQGDLLTMSLTQVAKLKEELTLSQRSAENWKIDHGKLQAELTEQRRLAQTLTATSGELTSLIEELERSFGDYQKKAELQMRKKKMSNIIAWTVAGIAGSVAFGVGLFLAIR